MPLVQNYAAALSHPETVNRWIRNVWRIVPDPDEYEFIQTPQLQLKGYEESGFLWGDCDDASTLAASLLVANHYPCWFVAIRMPNDIEFSHVFLRVPINGRLLDIDAVVPESRLPITGFAEEMTLDVI